MSQLYDIYQSDTFHLARSIVIKLDLVAEAINKELSFSGYEIAPDSPASYKYYLNLSGEYHKSDHDTLMRQYGSRHIMVDVATNTGYAPVAFTRELFHGDAANRSLLNEYQLGSNFYNRLVAKYPQFESLIKGVLSPIDIDEAIEAPNGAILAVAYQHRRTRENGDVYYTIPPTLKGTRTSTLIQPQEHNIITELQSWVSKSLFRWVVAGYSLTDDLYVPFVVGILSAMLPAKIMNIRWMNAHTSYAHTFHIKEYLNSHGMLGKYVQFIPLEQIMYLYRNVRYHELNLGKTTTFHALVDNMLTPTNVPMAGYYFKHDIAKMYGDNGKLLPEGRMMREHINFKSLGAGSDRRDIREILDRQIPLARENYRYIDNVEQQTRADIKWSGDDELIVKVLESELTDIADPIPVTLLSQLTWFWAYLSSQGRYTGSVFVSNPVSGERIALTPLTAFILMIYCANVAGRNQHLEFIPNDIVTAHWITKSSNVDNVPPEGGYHVKPSFDVMRNQTEKAHLSDKTIVDIIGDFEGEYNASSPNDFLSKIKDHHENLSRMFFTICKIEDSIGHGYGEHVWYNMFWHDIPVRLTDTPTKYSEWLPRLGIDFSYFTLADYDKLSVDLITECTGLNEVVDINRVELQRSMIEILKHFGSYTTHYLHSANQGTVSTASGKYIRVTKMQVDGDASLEEGVYIGLDMFNDKVDADIHQIVTLNPMDAVDHGLVDTVMDVSINPSFNVTVGEMSFGSIMPMAHIEVLYSELSYDDTPVIKNPTPPSWTVLYDYNQYLSKPYFLFDNKSVSVDFVGITADVNNEPDILDTLPTSGLRDVVGSLEQVATPVNVHINDVINVSGLSGISGISEHIVTTESNDSRDDIGVGLSPRVYVDIVAPNLNRHKDSVDVGVTAITGDVNDATVITVVDSTTVETIDIKGRTVDALPVSDGAGVKDITITTDTYDEPDLVEDNVVAIEEISGVAQDEPDLIDVANIGLDTVMGVVNDEPDLVEHSMVNVVELTGEAIDDRRSKSQSGVTIDNIVIAGKIADAENLIAGTPSTTGIIENITGDANDPIVKTAKDILVGHITRITGKSVDAVLPKRIRDSNVVGVSTITGTVYDQPTTKLDNANVMTSVVDITANVHDNYVVNRLEPMSVSIVGIVGSSYDTINTKYGDYLDFDVMTVTANIYDDVAPIKPTSFNIEIDGITGMVRELDKYLYTVASSTGGLVDITGTSSDQLYTTRVDSTELTVDAVDMRISDDVQLVDVTPLTFTEISASGIAYDQADYFVQGPSATATVSLIDGEVYDESTIAIINPISTQVNKITGGVRDDRSGRAHDEYWHRVSDVSGVVVDSPSPIKPDSTKITIDNVDGSIVDGDVSVSYSTVISDISISGDLVDGVINTYGSSARVNLVSINGNTVDDNAVFNSMSSTVETTQVLGRVYDEIATSYVDNTNTVTFVSTSGVVWDILPDARILNNNVTIVSITGDITDEDE